MCSIDRGPSRAKTLCFLLILNHRKSSVTYVFRLCLLLCYVYVCYVSLITVHMCMVWPCYCFVDGLS